MQKAVNKRMESLLKVTGITKKFQGLVAVDNVSIDMKEHTIHVLIGPNGAGKTTTVNLITGVLPLTSGKVEFGGKDITGMTTHDIARQGIGRTFQNIKVFPTMTLLENVMVGGHQQAPMGMMRGIFDIRGSRAEEKRLKEKAEEVLKRIGMYELRGSLMKNLPYGRQKISEIGRAMMNDPKLILLDEPAAGLDPEGRDEILSEVKDYHKKTGTTVLLVSHSMEDIAKYADKVLVMSRKKIAMYDTVEKVFARAPELLELGLSVPQVTKIFLKLREMGVDVPADVYTIPYAVKMILAAKARRDAGETLVLPRNKEQKGGAAGC